MQEAESSGGGRGGSKEKAAERVGQKLRGQLFSCWLAIVNVEY